MADPIDLQDQLRLEFWQLQNPSQVVTRLRKDFGQGLLDANAQQALIRCMQHPVTREYPPGDAYYRRLLKAVVLGAESDGEEAIDDVVQEHMRLLLQPAPTERQGDSDSSWCYKTFSYRASHSEAEKPAHDGCMDAEGALSKPTAAMQSLITLHVSQNLIEGSTGCYDWEAGYLLAEFVLSHPHHFKGKRCVELGCGSGVTGICLHRVGASAVILTDGNASTLQNCRHNLQINGVLQGINQGRPQEADSCQDVQVLQMSWEDSKCLGADILLGADLLYHPGIYELLVGQICLQLHQAARPGDAAVMFLATTVRDEANIENFMQLLAKKNLDAELLGNGCDLGLAVQFQNHLALAPRRPQLVLHSITWKSNPSM